MPIIRSAAEPVPVPPPRCPSRPGPSRPGSKPSRIASLPGPSGLGADSRPRSMSGLVAAAVEVAVIQELLGASRTLRAETRLVIGASSSVGMLERLRELVARSAKPAGWSAGPVRPGRRPARGLVPGWQPVLKPDTLDSPKLGKLGVRRRRLRLGGVGGVLDSWESIALAVASAVPVAREVPGVVPRLAAWRAERREARQRVSPRPTNGRMPVPTAACTARARRDRDWPSARPPKGSGSRSVRNASRPNDRIRRRTGRCDAMFTQRLDLGLGRGRHKVDDGSASRQHGRDQRDDVDQCRLDARPSSGSARCGRQGGIAQA